MEFISQPSNVTVCTGGVAVFTCVVDKNGVSINNAGWQRFSQNYGFLSISFLPFHTSNVLVSGDTLTDRLTVTNLTYNNNEDIYRCRITDDVVSDMAYLIVAGSYCITCSIVCVCMYAWFYKFCILQCMYIAQYVHCIVLGITRNVICDS